MRLQFCLRLAACSLSLLGCMGTTQLDPALNATRAAGMHGAVVSKSQEIRVIAQVDAWHGCVDIDDHFTPVRMVIENDRDEAVPITYDDFELVAQNGSRYGAVPPRQINGVVTMRMSSFYDDTDDAANCDFYIPRDWHYRGVGYYYDDYDRWISVGLPTPEMLRRALPEGVIPPHGQVEGFVFFQKLDEEAGTAVALVARLKDAKVRLRFVTRD